LLDNLGCTYSTDQSGLFVWARIPESETSGRDLSERLLREKRVFITPGFIFGFQGEKYIRISLCQPAEVITEAMNRLS